MSPAPEVQPLPYQQRRFVFIASLIVFFVSVPLLVFYAIGYRFDFTGNENNITSVGGMYVTSDVRDIDMFIDDAPVEDMRIFQRAAYIQNLESGMHKVHTQGFGVQTWVKELPVFPHFVTEIQSFNMPEVPQVRPITKYRTSNGNPVVFASSSPFLFASTSPSIVASSTATSSSYILRSEYAYVESLFASSSEEQLLLQAQNKHFVFDASSTSTNPNTATTTKTYRQTVLFEENENVYMQWEGSMSAIPYYYCVRKFTSSSSSVASLYGEHIERTLYAQLASVAQTDTQAKDGSICRKNSN